MSRVHDIGSDARAIPVCHELHDFVFVEHDAPRGRLAAGQQHPPFGALPMLAGACNPQETFGVRFVNHSWSICISITAIIHRPTGVHLKVLGWASKQHTAAAWRL